MKKLILLGFSMTVTLASLAQNTPLITMTAEVDGKTRTFNIGSAVANNTISVDWGNGTAVKVITAGEYDGLTSTDITGTPVNNGEIKIYTTGGFTYFEAVSRINEAGITSIDVSKAVELTKLYVNGNKLTTLDLSANTSLTRLYANNNNLKTLVLPPSVTYVNVQNNSLENFDATSVPNINYLHIGGNKLTSLDVSANNSLANLYVLDNQLTNFKLGSNSTPKLLVNVSANQLTTLDLSEATGLGTTSARLFAQNNKLTRITYTKLTSANLSGNKFTLATLPQQNITTLTYAPQQEMEIEAVDGIVDLSGEYIIGASNTTYTWYDANGTVISKNEYTEEAGKFTFNQSHEAAYCVLSNAALPKFTAANAFKTKTIKIEATTTGIADAAFNTPATGDVYSVNGTLIAKNADTAMLAKGIYIIKSGNKTTKVVK